LLHFVCVCVGGIISLPWLSKDLKKIYRRTTGFVAPSLYFSFANQYSLGGSFSFPILIYLAFQELVSLHVGCVTTWSRGSHHLVSELGFINQVISLILQHIKKNKNFFISFYYCPKYISSIKKEKQKKEKKSRSKRRLLVSAVEN